jgi:hypothetical protein
VTSRLGTGKTINFFYSGFVLTWFLLYGTDHAPTSPSSPAKLGQEADLVHAYNQLLLAALQRHSTENSKQIFPEKEMHGHSLSFHIHVSVSDLCIPTTDLPILLQENMWMDHQSWEYINRSQTHECGNRV